MDTLIKVKSASYKRYEELLLEKEELLKEAENYRIEYERIFDSLSKEVNIAKLDCVKKRKIISYCKNALTSKSKISRNELDKFVEKAMKDYEETLDFLSRNDDEEKEEKEIVEKDLKALKNLYHQLAKQIHPDMNSNLSEDKVIRDLWNRICIAYNCKDFEELEELNILVNRYLEKSFKSYIEYEIPDINEKIFNLNRKIYRITHTIPYQHKYILEDKEGIEKKKDELTKELNDYKRYAIDLDNKIESYSMFIFDD